MCGWRNISVETGDVHTIPDNDEREHFLTVDCWCKPRVEIVKSQNNVDYMYYCHNSADGREALEWAETILEQSAR